ncbi:DUF305 domain-containing protein [Microbacterium sp. DT81.1]|uniref:DUF305 domain-containing protein n=1 Tax=Microbacterium sp. DT81.1 TaxID=3393413 RepID=UPI003CF24037
MKTRPGAASTLILAALLILTGCAGTAGGDDDMSDMDHASGAAVDANEDDIEFASTMIAHHEQAIEASDIVLEKDDVDGSVTELADRIKVAYETDIDQLETWLDEWHATAEPEEPDADDGMITDADLDALRSASGTAAGSLYLEQMIADHEGAIEIAEEHIEEGKNPGAIDLSKKIVAAQTLEIERMKELLDGL